MRGDDLRDVRRETAFSCAHEDLESGILRKNGYTPCESKHQESVAGAGSRSSLRRSASFSEDAEVFSQRLVVPTSQHGPDPHACCAA